jgi:hypothetical protein
MRAAQRSSEHSTAALDYMRRAFVPALEQQLQQRKRRLNALPPF